MSLPIRTFSPGFLLRTSIRVLLLERDLLSPAPSHPCHHPNPWSLLGRIEWSRLKHRKNRCSLDGMSWLNYHHLLYFWTVAREGTIARACVQLHLTEPTISGQLRSLEKALGAKLF